MPSCCDDKACEVTALREQHSRILWVVLAVNATMFVVELVAGVRAGSTSLLADSLDMLGDASVYGLTLVALRRSTRWQAGAAVSKGAFMLVFGLAVLAEAISKAPSPVVPTAEIMGLIGALALAANLACFGLLWKHRGDNLNMSSTWLCSRNDLIANVGVLVAAGATYLTASRWPDILVGCVIAILFVKSATYVLTHGVRALRTEPREVRRYAARAPERDANQLAK